MKLHVEIRRNSDGLTRTNLMDLDDFSLFYWSEGNGCCDCNRAMWFADAAGDKDREADSYCGHDRFDIRIKDDAGNILYDEFNGERKGRDDRNNRSYTCGHGVRLGDGAGPTWMQLCAHYAVP